MELNWDPDWKDRWDWLCLECEADDWVEPEALASALHKAEQVKILEKKDVVPIICPYCQTDALILEKHLR